ncbi:GGDEF domain-containing protein [Desulforamulus aeronauticus]|uniref:Diguanylate cyclase (GGDEF) domain-containing protein n=1 Tax=Desulforamulus aeronauticus DSM 10349 TaxID=1121421 RepID=A0A1M6VVJ3_9FIRM|nr:GGDEF domain-containing protein [Desulforamulus aeronauticus]SHK85552.1 diguanylate cyclase (GGDEF) domain-containing protein [Desulforamulus aeronauticus DSM 10349]
MICVEQIMETELITITPDDSVKLAIDLMDKYKVGGLPVLENRKPVGIITSRDVRRAHPNRLVVDAMSSEVIVALPHFSLWYAKELMEQHNIERLVVTKDGYMAGLITKAKLNAELGKHIDGLTGLHKANFLYVKALEFLQRVQEITIIFLDLDDFGNIDKQFGHVVGDSILCQTSRVLKGVIQENMDYLCRYAGDEFAIVTIRSWRDVQYFAERIINEFSLAEWPQGIKVRGSVGIAGGVRCFSNSNDSRAYSVSDLINMASLASTTAKREKISIVVHGQVEVRSEF